MGRDRFTKAFDNHNMVPGPAGTATPQVIWKTEDGIMLVYATSKPADASTGYSEGCICIIPNASGGATAYINEGSDTSSDFNLLITEDNLSAQSAALLTAANAATILDTGVPVSYALNSGTAAGIGPSPLIWDDCPLLDIMMDPTVGVYYFNDYVDRLGGGQQSLTGTSTTEISDWIQTEVTSGLTTRSEVNGGVLRVSSEASVAANDGLTVMYRATPFIPADGKTIWFEARIALTNIDAGAGAEDQFFIGLCDTITSALPGGVVDDTVDKIGFFHHDGSIVATLSFITADGATEEITASAATGLVTGTFLKVGFKCTMVGAAQVVTPYVNGVAGTPHVTEASLPDATGMGICFAAVSEGTTTALMDVDWVRVAQLR